MPALLFPRTTIENSGLNRLDFLILLSTFLQSSNFLLRILSKSCDIYSSLKLLISIYIYYKSFQSELLFFSCERSSGIFIDYVGLVFVFNYSFNIYYKISNLLSYTVSCRCNLFNLTPLCWSLVLSDFFFYTIRYDYNRTKQNIKI